MNTQTQNRSFYNQRFLVNRKVISILLIVVYLASKLVVQLITRIKRLIQHNSKKTQQNF